MGVIVTARAICCKPPSLGFGGLMGKPRHCNCISTKWAEYADGNHELLVIHLISDALCSIASVIRVQQVHRREMEMPKNESVQFFLRFLEERFKAFRQALSAFLQNLSLEDRDKKVLAANEVLRSLDNLKLAMSPSDHPDWIGPLEQKFKWYVKHHQSGIESGRIVLDAILDLHGQINSQQWKFADAEATNAIDFNAIYQEYYRGSRVPELFDELVRQLENIIASNAIDSIQTVKALEKLIATIKRNARADYFSTRGAWEVTRGFLKNLIVEVLEDVPVLKPVVKAIRKTASELDLEMLQVHDQVKLRLSESVGLALPTLDYKPSLPVLEYKSLALPAPDPNGSVDELPQ